MKKCLFGAVVLFMLVPMCIATAQEAAVIAHPGVGISELSASQVADIFTGAKKLVGDKEVKLFVLPPDHPVSVSFFDKVLGTTATKFNQQWLRRTFSGDGSAPTKVSSEGEITKLVAATPGAVAYIGKNSASSAEGCKVIKVQ